MNKPTTGFVGDKGRMTMDISRRRLLRMAGAGLAFAFGDGFLTPDRWFGLRRAMAGNGEGTQGPGRSTTPLMFASTRLHAPIYAHTVDHEDQTHRISQVAVDTPTQAVHAPRFAFVNWYSLSGKRRPAEFDTGNALTIRGASAMIDGIFHPLSFHGQPSYVLGSGGFVISDPLDVTLAGETRISIRTADEVSLNAQRPGGLFRQAFRTEACQVGRAFSADLLSSGTLEQNFSRGGLYGPCFMVAEGWRGWPVALSLGDSICFGQEDFGEHADPRGNFGYVARGLDAAEGGRIPYAQMAVPASAPSEVSSLAEGHFKRRHELLRAVRHLGGRWPFTHIVSEHGVNDSYASGDWTVLKGIMQDWWDFLDATYEGTPILQTTYTPRSLAEAPDFFTMLQAQSEAQNNHYPEGVRWRVADFIRTIPRPLRGVIEMQPYFSDATDPGKWAPRSFATTLADDVGAGESTILLAEAPGLGELLILSPGDKERADVGEGTLTVDAVSGSGPYRVALSGETAKAHAAKSAVKAMGTRDGSHPSSLLHARAAQAMIDAKRSGLFRVPG